MFLLIAQSAALLVAVFLFSGFIGWHLTPKPKRAVRRISVFDDTPAQMVDATLDAPLNAPVAVPAAVSVAAASVDPMVAAAQAFNASRQQAFSAPPATEARSAEIIPLRPAQAAAVPPAAPQPAPVGVSTELEPAIMGDIETPAALVASAVQVEATVQTEILDRTSRPKASLLSAMTPESVSAAVEQAGTGLEPHRLRGAEGQADDLTLISGIGASNQKELNDLGIFHYWQVASWTPEHVAWLSARVHSAQRIARENWMAQAARLAARAA